jgi:hypothetical protein
MPDSSPEKRSGNGKRSGKKCRAGDVLPLDPIFHVGFTGHRDLGIANADCSAASGAETLEQELSGQISRVIADIRQAIKSRGWGKLYTDKPPIVKFISSLAEGSDRIGARCALEAGLPMLYCLPFQRDAYESDFVSAASKQEYRELLSASEAVFEIDFERNHPVKAYFHAGRVMVDHSDILIAVWDGEDPDHIGGTAHVVDYARRADIPILWIHSSGVQPIRIIDAEGVREYTGELLAEKINSDVYHGAKAGRGTGKSITDGDVRRFLAEKQSARNCWVFGYRLLLRLLSPRECRQKLSSAVPDFVKSADASLFNGRGGGEGECSLDGKRGTINTQFGWADNLAIRYSDVYRTVGVVRHVFGLLVTVALCFGFYYGFWQGSWKGNPMAPAGFSWVPVAGDNWGNLLGFLFQALFLGAIMALAYFNSSRKWHQKFMDYRILAETIRATRYLHPMGITISGVEVPAYHGQSFTWTNLQLRSLVRNLGIPDGKLDRKSLLNYLGELCGFLKGQEAYHETSFNRYESATRILGKLWQYLFLLGILFILLRVGIHFAGKYHWFDAVGSWCSDPLRDAFIRLDGWNAPLKKVFNLFSLLVPALGVFFYTLLTQLGFEKLRDRSAEMKNQLKDAESRLRRLIREIDSGSGVPFDRAREIALHSCRIILREVADWRVFVSSKPITKS